MLGHSQISVTLDTYSHVTPTMQKQATAAMDALLRARSRRVGVKSEEQHRNPSVAKDFSMGNREPMKGLEPPTRALRIPGQPSSECHLVQS